MNSEILDYLSEMNFKESKNFLENLKTKKYSTKFKLSDSDKIVTADLHAALEPGLFHIQVSKSTDFNSGEGTFKISIGTEVFFFKTKIFLKSSRLYIQGPFSIFKLIRRKSTRYNVPSYWPQSGFISDSSKKMLSAKMRVIEISLSGIKVHVMAELPRYEKNQLVHVQFKIFRRSELNIGGHIKHVERNQIKGGQTLGIEFVQSTQLIQNKIQNICEDLLHSLA
ncbi:MAG: hypothetical protein A2622_08375 [Bdellovibrionales bacterium RIFCSPHIGHO2_01_FULL_40_29]|nr:MAG: hypothetical protein A2622_08375 [Bdellovibrionales bacterium RIFCSPHIGHO2_01_FULL_40_29]OFZ35509.1 MAG: hypothetical protein A3D17_07610 [Bdellovibrionales bacterium RIFCSPHIGHO2_02_FULL_40_15]